MSEQQGIDKRKHDGAPHGELGNRGAIDIAAVRAPRRGDVAGWWTPGTRTRTRRGGLGE